MSEHTPGPWKLDGYTVMKGLDTIAVCPNGWSDDEANARLIAAAPDLLKACQLAEVQLANCVPVGKPNMAMSAIRVALKKALTTSPQNPSSNPK
jgi:hypothetical protein